MGGEMVMDEDLTWHGEHTIQCTREVCVELCTYNLYIFVSKKEKKKKYQKHIV